MNVYEIKRRLIRNGVNALKDSYPNVDEENILTDAIYKEFFRSMLEDNRGVSPKIDDAITELIEKIRNVKPKEKNEED